MFGFRFSNWFNKSYWLSRFSRGTLLTMLTKFNRFGGFFDWLTYDCCFAVDVGLSFLTCVCFYYVRLTITTIFVMTMLKMCACCVCLSSSSGTSSCRHDDHPVHDDAQNCLCFCLISWIKHCALYSSMIVIFCCVLNSYAFVVLLFVGRPRPRLCSASPTSSSS